MTVKTADQHNWKKIRKNMDKSYSIETSKHIPMSFALSICYSKDAKCKNGYFCCRGGDCFDTFLDNINKIVQDFANFPRQKNK